MELWASDTSAFYGTLVATFPDGFTSRTLSQRIDEATPFRYWTLRMYDPDNRMRLDSMRFFGETADGSVRSEVCAAPSITEVDGVPNGAVGSVGAIPPPTETVITIPYPFAGDASPPPAPYIGTIAHSERFGRRLMTHHERRRTDSASNELLVLWTVALQNVSDHPPQNYVQAKAMVADLIKLHFAAYENVTDELLALPNASRSPTGGYSDDDADDDEGGYNFTERQVWWLNLEEHHDELDDSGLFNLYPIRTPPKAFGRSPAASLATAMALTNGTESGLPDALHAEQLLVNLSCAHLGGCDEHDMVLETSPLLSTPFRPEFPHSATMREDGPWIAWLLSASVAPVVHLITSEMLVCASNDTCGEACDACARMGVALQNNSAPDVIRAVETALGGGGERSVDLVECVQTASCIGDVGERAAEQLQTFVFSAETSVAKAAEANAKLWTYARDEAEANRSFAERRVTRAEVAKAHQAALGVKAPPSWVRPHVVEHGRSLAETLAETLNGDFGDNETRLVTWIQSLEPAEQELFFTSLQTSTTIRENGTLFDIQQANLQFLQTWARHGAEYGDKAEGRGVCSDPQFVNRTVACKVHAVLVSKAITHMRREAKRREEDAAHGGQRPRRRASNEAEIKQAVEQNLRSACCARFEDGREECGEKYCEHHFAQELVKRMGHVVRKMSQTNHPAAKKVGPDIHAIIENVLLPEFHPDPECRVINASSLHYGGITRTECIGKSLVHHASKKYGVDSETIQKKIEKIGLTTGKTVQAIEKATGIIAEVRSAGNALKRRRERATKAKAHSNAARMLRDAEKRGGAKRTAAGRRMGEVDGGDAESRGTPGQRHAALRRRQLEAEEAAMSDEELAHRRAVTRGTDVADGQHRHGFAHSASTIKAARAARRNATAEIDRSFKRMEERAQSRRLQQVARGRAGGARLDKVPNAMSFHRDNARQHAIDPVFAVEVLEADEGSVYTRFAGGVAKLGEVARRWSALHLKSHEVDVARRRRRGRQLAEGAHAKKAAERLYSELDRQTEAREDAHVVELAKTVEGRRLDETALRKQAKAATRRRIPELKPDHALSFLHELVDWPSAADEWNRVHDLLTQRHAMRLQGRNMREILDTHPTGYTLLDDHDRFSFSKVGDALRRLWHRRVNKTDRHFVDHVNSEHDHAGKHAPERHGRLRRLSEGFLGPVVAAPYSLFDTVLYGTAGGGASESVTIPETGEDIFTAAIRYIVYGTIGCYLVSPKRNPVTSGIDNPEDASEGADGEALKVFRPDDTFLCFPAIPFVLPRLPTWRQFTKSDGVEYHKLTYEVRTARRIHPCPSRSNLSSTVCAQEYCTGNGFQQQARDFFENTLGLRIQTETARWLGVPGALRGAEAIDSIVNFVDSANAPEGDWVIGYLLCGIVRRCSHAPLCPNALAHTARRMCAGRARRRRLHAHRAHRTHHPHPADPGREHRHWHRV